MITRLLLACLCLALVGCDETPAAPPAEPTECAPLPPGLMPIIGADSTVNLPCIETTERAPQGD